MLITFILVFTVSAIFLSLTSINPLPYIIVLSIGCVLVVLKMFSKNYVRYVHIEDEYIEVDYYSKPFVLQKQQIPLESIHWTFRKVLVGQVSSAIELTGANDERKLKFKFTDRYFIWSSSNIKKLVEKIEERGITVQYG